MPNRPIIYVSSSDEQQIRCIRQLVESVGLKATGFADDAMLFREFTDKRPGCLVLDAPVPGSRGLQLQRMLVDRNIMLPLVVITRFPEVATAVEAIKGGAVDYLELPFDEQILLERVQAAVRCHAEYLREASDRVEIEARLASLTRREREVLDYVIAGMPSRKIADCLKLSAKTVEVHRAHLMHKVEASGVADLVRMVMAVRADGSGPLGQSDRPVSD